MKTEPSIGYTKETAQKYTEGLRQFFDVDHVVDGATVAMEEEIKALAEKHSIQTVCDIGCGANCAYLRSWKASAVAENVIGIEPSPHMREILERDLASTDDAESVEVISGDWGDVPVPNDSVDLVVSRFSLHHLQNIREGYRELSRVLKIGGHAVISLPHPEYCARELEKQKIVPQEGIPMSVQVFDTTLHYYYHEINSYLGSSLLENGLRLVKHSSFNWGTNDETEKQIPNTLLFVLEKV